MSDSDIPNLQQQMRQHPALWAGVKAMRASATYREQIYARAMNQLDGVAFDPLAGIRVTLHTRNATEKQRQDTQVFSGHYVEYLTGHQRVMTATVELIGGYVPMGVDPTAFQDALHTGLESRFNECGYTLQAVAPDGLRALSRWIIGNPMLEILFNPLSVLDNVRLSIQEVSSTVEEGNIVLRLPVSMVTEKPDLPLTVAFSYSDNPRWNRVHRSELGHLAALDSAYIWFATPKYYSDPSPSWRAVITHTDTLPQSAFSDLTKLPKIDSVWEVNSTPDNTIAQALPGFAWGMVLNQILTVYIPIDFSPRCDRGYIVFEDIGDWVEMVAYEIFHPESPLHPEQASKTYYRAQKKNVVEMCYFNNVRDLAATASWVHAPKEVAPTVAVVESKPRSTFRARLASAIAAFRCPPQ